MSRPKHRDPACPKERAVPLPGWDGGYWTVPEPWRFLIDKGYVIGRGFGGWFEDKLRKTFDVGQYEQAKWR